MNKNFTILKFKNFHVTWLESKTRVNSSQNDSIFYSSQIFLSNWLDFWVTRVNFRVNVTRVLTQYDSKYVESIESNWLEFNSSCSSLTRVSKFLTRLALDSTRVTRVMTRLITDIYIYIYLLLYIKIVIFFYSEKTSWKSNNFFNVA